MGHLVQSLQVVRESRFATGRAAALPLGVAICLIFGHSTALAAPNDAGTGSYTREAGSNNTFDVTINNTGTTNHLNDYAEAPTGIPTTGCAIKSAPPGSTCTPGITGPTTEVNIGSGGLPPEQSIVFSFTIVGDDGGMPCVPLRGAVNSTGDQGQYTPITIGAGAKCADFQANSPLVYLVFKGKKEGGTEPTYYFPKTEFSADDQAEVIGNVLNRGPSDAVCEVALSGAIFAPGSSANCPPVAALTETQPVPNQLTGHYIAATAIPQSAGSARGTRQTISVTAAPTDAIDPNLANNSASATITVYGTPAERPDVGKPGAKGVSGSLQANGAKKRLTGGAAAKSTIKRVQVAILNTTKKTCRWVKSVKGKFTKARSATACDPPVWLKARGTSKWSLKLKKRLPRGKYVFLARALDSKGNRSGGFTKARGTLAKLTVK